MIENNRNGAFALKTVVSVSLGSSTRDHKAQAELLGEQFEVSRLGTDGDFKKAIRVLKDLDGKVDAIDLGGIDIYLYAGKKRYAIKDALKLAGAVQKTPVVDGSGLKNTLERQTIAYLKENTDLLPAGTPVLMVSGADRFGINSKKPWDQIKPEEYTKLLEKLHFTPRFKQLQ